MIKGLVVGGTGNIGKLICDRLSFDSVSPSNGYKVPENLDKIIHLSYNYNVVINCIPDINQNILLESLFEEHSKKDLDTYLITLGSMSYKMNSSDHPKNKILEFSESILLRKSKVKHTLINLTWCFNNRDIDIMSVISKEDIVDVFNFLIESKDKNSVVSMIEIKGKNVL